MYKFLDNNNKNPKSINKTLYTCILARMMRTVNEIFKLKKEKENIIKIHFN